MTPQRKSPKKLIIPVAMRMTGLKRIPMRMVPIAKTHPMMARTQPTSHTQYPMRASIGMCDVWKMPLIPERNDGIASPMDPGQAVGIRNR